MNGLNEKINKEGMFQFQAWHAMYF